jgi:hypothetical protein
MAIEVYLTIPMALQTALAPLWEKSLETEWLDQLA